MSAFIFDFAAESPKASTPKTGSPRVRGRFAQKQHRASNWAKWTKTLAYSIWTTQQLALSFGSWRLVRGFTLMPDSRQKSVNPTRGMGIMAESALTTIATRSRRVPMNGNYRTAHDRSRV